MSTIKSGKLKVLFYTEGFDGVQAPIRRYKQLAKHIDRDRFSCVFVSRLRSDDTGAGIRGLENYQPTIDYIKSFGHTVVLPPKVSPTQRLVRLEKYISELKPDIYATYVLTSIADAHMMGRFARVAGSKLVKFCLAFPECSALVNATVHHSATTFDVDTNANKILIPSRYDPEMALDDMNSGVTRADLGIPEHAVVLATIGRDNMVQRTRQEAKYLVRVLQDNPNAFYLSIGSGANFDHPQMGSTEFRRDVCSILKLVDIGLDTWPQGGGWTIPQFCMMKIPMVVMQTALNFSWCNKALTDTLNIPELSPPWAHWNTWSRLLNALIQIPEYRMEMSIKAGDRGNELANYHEYMRAVEELFIDVHSDVHSLKWRNSCVYSGFQGEANVH